jgi:hypothetical protein
MTFYERTVDLGLKAYKTTLSPFIGRQCRYLADLFGIRGPGAQGSRTPEGVLARGGTDLPLQSVRRFGYDPPPPPRDAAQVEM